MSPDSLDSRTADRPIQPSATDSIHGPFLETAVPQWLIGASAQRKAEFKQARPLMPAWYARATARQRQVLHASFRSSFRAQMRLDKTMSGFKDIDAFARPILLQALKSRFQVEVDVDKTLLSLRRAVRAGIISVEFGTVEALTLPMLQAALHNFESDECVFGAFHGSSGFVIETATAGTYKSVPVNVSVRNFLSLCRDLDIGTKYQAYLKTFFHPADPKAQETLRRDFIASQKAAMRAAAERALLTKEIRPQDHAMIVSVLNGERRPRVDNKPVWFHDMGLMQHRLVGCVAFTIAEKYQSVEAVILYVPNDPEHPLKRYTGTQMSDTLKRLLSARPAHQAKTAEPTAYQRFFSQFMPYEKRAYYFSQFVKSADPWSDWLSSVWRAVLQTSPIFSDIWKVSAKPPKMQPEPDPYVAASLMPHRQVYPWQPNNDLWQYLYEKHRDKVIADARAHAVPTRDIDAKARDAKLAGLEQLGLLALNVASMFVPVIGEIMMVVMVGQLLYETIEGVVEWSEGDRHAAKEHLLDVAENLAQIAVMAGGGVVFNKINAVRPEPVIEQLQPVTLANGRTRLWKPDFTGYEHDIALAQAAVPNHLGQYRIDGKTCIRLGGEIYVQVFDRSTGQWRLKHPTERNAYRPALAHNGHGAWRLVSEQPMTWQRLELLRRMGHSTDGFSDDRLLMLGDISGVSDSTLRQMHMDHLPPPPELRDAMQLFEADAAARQMIEQLRGARAIDERYLHALPLVTELPRWPHGRVLEIFAGAQETEQSIQYGLENVLPGIERKPVIRISRAQVLNGEMPARIVAALEENEVIRLLGSRAAQFRPARPDEFMRLLAEFAYTRQSAIFDSLYRGTEPLSLRARILQRECPGLSNAAAQDVLGHATAAELARMDHTGRSPLKLLEEARWHVRRGRQTRAFAGLHSENLASADSRRLALFALERLPEWSPTLRLEIREGSTTGALLDSVGEPSAPVKRYLVKNGPFYQAFNAQAQVLNRISRVEDSFYRSLMYALPDDMRAALGLYEGSKGGELQHQIILSARVHWREALHMLAPRAKWFKPPVRVRARMTGYYASGRGGGWSTSLEMRVAQLYPLPRQAAAFLARQRGRSDAQIYQELELRRREWESLNVTLERWQAVPGSSQTAEHRARLARTLREAWRNGPLAGRVADVARLSLVCDASVPALSTRFPHVRELAVSGIGLTDANVDGLLAAFPNVTDLQIGEVRDPRVFTVAGRSLTTVPQALGQLTGLTQLRFVTDAPFLAPTFAQRLRALTSLETLHINYSGADASTLNDLELSTLTHLRSLRIDAPNALWRWPAYVERLPRLGRLDLTHTLIETLPDSLYHGHEQLWAGLSLNWARVTPTTFRRAYDYVSQYSGPFGHLLDLHQMVRGFCRAELDTMAPASGFVDLLPEAFYTALATPQARVTAIESIRAEHEAIFAQFYTPTLRHGTRYSTVRSRWATGPDAEVLRALKTNWYGTLRQRYGLTANVDRFELPGPRSSSEALPAAERFRELPQLPAGSFAHVRTVRLRQLDVPIDQARGFLRAFSHVESLEISGNRFTELPFAADDLRALKNLDASDNAIVVTPGVQRQLSGLQQVRWLNLRDNPLHAVDVSALSRLRALNLRSTSLQTWPLGAERLARLSWLDLRDNRIASLPEPVLSHPDVLMRSNLTGNRFSPEGQASLDAAFQRIEQQKALEQGTLAQFAAQRVPDTFPPAESGWSFIELLLPLPEEALVNPAQSGTSLHVQRLNQLMPRQQAELNVQHLQASGLSDAQIEARITEWHRSCEALIRRLNGWLYNREIPTADGPITAGRRSSAGRLIRDAWLGGLTEASGSVVRELELADLRIGDLPELPVQFPAVTTLDLSRVGLSTRGSDGFLNAFQDLRTLLLSGNELGALPGPVLRMRHLQHLRMQHCNLQSATSFYPLLGRGRLHMLDVGYNQLRVFNPPDFSALQLLDLRTNHLSEWPAGAQQAAHLRGLNLHNNRIVDVPGELFNGNHERLLQGTDLSANARLSLTALLDLRRYARERAAPYVMQLSQESIDELIDRHVIGPDQPQPPGAVEGAGNNAVAPDPYAGVQPSEAIFDPANDIAPESRDPWLMDSDLALAAQRRSIWTQLALEPNHQRFFQLLRLLRDTEEFKRVPADLTHRVWQVMEAATENTELRNSLFNDAETHGTCPDGRILTFSDMQVRVWVYRTLQGIPVSRTMARGRALWQVSRQLFRLEWVEIFAEVLAKGQDRAEVRLQSRIDLTRGWGDGLDLPGQPSHMLYARPLTDEVLAQVRIWVLEAEQTDELPANMGERDYWIAYLQERYPQEMEAIDVEIEELQQVGGELKERRERGELTENQYELELKALARAVHALRRQRRLELTRREIDLLRAFADDSQQPGRLEPQPGTSSLP